MNRLLTVLVLLIGPVLPCMPAPSEAEQLVDLLRIGNIESVRINLVPGGADIGFELEVTGTDPDLEPLLELIRGMKPGGGHKCPNAGSIRFRMNGGGTIGIGLLPSHTKGLYGFRLYDGDRHLQTFTLDRGALLEAMDRLGVPTAAYAFRE
jgi:hypothetical protein